MLLTLLLSPLAHSADLVLGSKTTEIPADAISTNIAKNLFGQIMVHPKYQENALLNSLISAKSGQANQLDVITLTLYLSALNTDPTKIADAERNFIINVFPQLSHVLKALYHVPSFENCVVMAQKIFEELTKKNGTEFRITPTPKKVLGLLELMRANLRTEYLVQMQGNGEIGIHHGIPMTALSNALHDLGHGLADNHTVHPDDPNYMNYVMQQAITASIIKHLKDAKDTGKITQQEFNKFMIVAFRDRHELFKKKTKQFKGGFYGYLQEVESAYLHEVKPFGNLYNTSVKDGSSPLTDAEILSGLGASPLHYRLIRTPDQLMVEPIEGKGAPIFDGGARTLRGEVIDAVDTLWRLKNYRYRNVDGHERPSFDTLLQQAKDLIEAGDNNKAIDWLRAIYEEEAEVVHNVIKRLQKIYASVDSMFENTLYELVRAVPTRNVIIQEEALARKPLGEQYSFYTNEAKGRNTVLQEEERELVGFISATESNVRVQIEQEESAAVTNYYQTTPPLFLTLPSMATINCLPGVYERFLQWQQDKISTAEEQAREGIKQAWQEEKDPQVKAVEARHSFFANEDVMRKYNEYVEKNGMDDIRQMDEDERSKVQTLVDDKQG